MNTTAMKEENVIKIICIGSPFGTDRIGWEIADLLEAEITFDKDLQIRIIKEDRPGVGLLRHFEGTDTVFLIDAVLADKPVGTIVRLTPDQIENIKSVFSTHGIGLAEAIELGKALNVLPKILIIYGIDVGSLDSADLSDAIFIDAKQQFVDALKQELSKLKNG
ncbi:MAG: hydrogenase maturation protease [Pseudomonadota bacterium]|nr:hydrogenase maturation protease [Gammaproteobacteria bacterium]MBU1558534.1 hydrogenase maturation protease [Gammaproteobacteria bacterium]MBU1629407.1 hydrogenase maturation protease [Gammaproteobacteria bacterium]MBU1926559.1 hydrogenase maturation protease [Gammaproteobacteria bacterium]MBU2546615.1 hydrogenase maturation protease [Gammaproteobacteria bacterium]